LLKRLTAISLILIIVFNFYGYRLVITCMQSNSEAYLEKQMDENRYDEQELVSIKTKLNLPYYTSSAQYERAYGAISINGIEYQYVKRRVYNDTLELLCLPNQVKTKLQSVNNELTRALSDGQASVPKKNATIKITLPDFFQPLKTYTASRFLLAKPNFSEYVFYLPTVDGIKLKKPPKQFLFLS
jgi:hypothetical protein